MWISKVLSRLRLSLVSYVVLGLVLDLVLNAELVLDLVLGLVLGAELVLDLGLGSLSILFMVEYQFFWYLYMLSLDLCLVWGTVVKVSLYGLV